MASVIRIKRSNTAGDPTTLGSGELAYSALTGTQANGGDRLYLGFGTETAGNAANHFVIGGKYFTDLLKHTHGSLIASAGVIVDSNKKIDQWNVDNITIDSNTISSTDTNGNILLDPNGTGYVSIIGTNGVVIPVGTTAQRGPAIQGTIRYNNDTSQFEGYSGTNWGSLGGVKSVDGYTYITAESSPAASDGIIHFYAETAAGTASVEVAQLDRTKLSLLQSTTSTSASTGSLVITGGAGISENLNVGGTATVTGNATFNSNLTIIGSDTPATEYFKIKNGTGTDKFIVDSSSGDTTIIGDLAVNGGDITTTATTFNHINTTATTINAFGAGTTITIGAANTGTTTIRNATVAITNAATVGSTLGVTGVATLSSNATVGGTLGVTGATTLSNTLGVTGAATLSSTLGVTGAATLSSTLAVTGAATLSSTLAVNGGDITTTATTFNHINTTATTINAFGAGTTITIGAANTGTTTIRNATVAITNAATVGSTLGVTGVATLSSNATVGGTLGVTGATTLSNTLGVTGAATLSSTLGVTGAATLSSTLAVTGTSTFNTATVHNGGITTNPNNNLSISSGTGNTTINLTPQGTGTVDVASKRITSVADPTQAQDAATKNYVDAVKTGLDVKESVRVATTTNLTATYSNGTSGVGATLTNSGALAAITIDGVSLSVGERILIKDQTVGLQNGIYTVTTVGSGAAAWVLTRATDADANSPIVEVGPGMFTFVEEGTTNADNGFVCTNNGTITIGTTAITWVQFSGAGQITAGAGLTKTGNTLDVGGTTDRITVAADSIDIAATYAGQNTITTVGTIGTGTWQGSVISGQYGGTGINNSGKTITLGGNLTTSGAFATTLTVTAATSVTLPTAGTLATLAGTETFTNKTLTSPTINSGALSGTFSGNFTLSGIVTLSNTTDSTTTATGALVVAGGIGVAKSMYIGGNLTGAGAAVSILDGFTIDGGTY